jgi:hypothetical protein
MRGGVDFDAQDEVRPPADQAAAEDPAGRTPDLSTSLSEDAVPLRPRSHESKVQEHDERMRVVLGRRRRG